MQPVQNELLSCGAAKMKVTLLHSFSEAKELVQSYNMLVAESKQSANSDTAGHLAEVLLAQLQSWREICEQD